MSLESLRKEWRKAVAGQGRGTDGCPRCGDTVAAVAGGHVLSVTRRGEPIPNPQEFIREEQPGNRCPVCGTVRRELFRVGGYKPSKS